MVCVGRAGRGGEWGERERGEERREEEGGGGACVFVGGGREQLCLWDPWNPNVCQITVLPLSSSLHFSFSNFPFPFVQRNKFYPEIRMELAFRKILFPVVLVWMQV